LISFLTKGILIHAPQWFSRSNIKWKGTFPLKNRLKYNRKRPWPTKFVQIIIIRYVNSILIMEWMENITLFFMDQQGERSNCILCIRWYSPWHSLASDTYPFTTILFYKTHNVWCWSKKQQVIKKCTRVASNIKMSTR
jgi:hypothetical protein